MNDDTPERTTEERWWPSRYGAGDQLGTLNEITPARVAAAARLVRQGRTFDLGRTLHADVPRFEGRYWQQSLVSSAHIINPRKPAGQPGGWGRNRINWVTELVTGTLQIGTHLDGLNHLQIGDRFYNGFRLEEIAEEWGTNKLGIETVPPIITRGVLADIARYRGVSQMQPGEVIAVADLEGALRAQGVIVTPGDVLLFHTGWGALWDEDPALHLGRARRRHGRGRMARRAARCAEWRRHLELRRGARRRPGAPVRRAADAEREARTVHHGEPGHVHARRRAGLRVHVRPDSP